MSRQLKPSSERPSSVIEKDGPSETATLIGDRGEQLILGIGQVILGRKKVSSLGPGCNRAADGTLQIVVDRASYEALELDR